MPEIIKHCTREDLPSILEIFNEAILNTTAFYHYDALDMQWMEQWFVNKISGNYPILGAFDADGKLMGFASYGAFRVQPGYKNTVEHSVYVHKDFRGKGLGKLLLTEIIQQARNQKYHVMIGVIDADNKISIDMHSRAGFQISGILKQAGFKFDRWLDVAFMQLILD